MHCNTALVSAKDSFCWRASVHQGKKLTDKKPDLNDESQLARHFGLPRQIYSVRILRKFPYTSYHSKVLITT